VGQIGKFNPFPDTPDGKKLPIPCKYPFGQDRPLPDDYIQPLHDRPLPDGWKTEWLKHDDSRVEEAGFHVAPLWLDVETQMAHFEDGPGRQPVSYPFLVTDRDVIVATWDEGRWWTPEESAQFDLMLRVPATIEIAELGPKGEFGL